MPDDSLIFLPALFAGMQEAKLLTWHVRQGQAIVAGQVIAEFESDKAVMELQAERSGVLEALLVSEGAEGVKVGSAIARLRAESAGGA